MPARPDPCPDPVLIGHPDPGRPDPEPPDRRPDPVLIPVLIVRPDPAVLIRRPDLAHGTRGRYRAGCRCPACRAASAQARAVLRQRELEGRPALGARVPAGQTRVLWQALQREQMSSAMMARQLGLRSRLRVRYAYVSWRTVLRLRRLWRLVS
jgi:hypothetical protein